MLKLRRVLIIMLEVVIGVSFPAKRSGRESPSVLSYRQCAHLIRKY
jgi:hypothetical protein